MSDDDVYPDEMDAPHEFDDRAAEALLSGSGRGIDPQLADLFDDMRVAYTSQPPAAGAELAAVLAEAELTPEASPTRRFERMRSSLVARAGAAAAAAFAVTGGLAVAHALPASMQNATSEIGVGAPAHHGHHVHDALEVKPDDSTTTTIEHETVPGREKDAVDHDADDNDRGAAVGGHEGDNDDQNEQECEAEEQNEQAEHDDEAVTSTSVACVPTTATTVPESRDGNEGENSGDNEHSTVATVPESHDGEQGTSGSSGSGDDQHVTTPTTMSHSDGGDDSNSGSGDGGSSHGG
jgi:hypothetical protein